MTAFLHYDVFTSTPFEGNQLAVFTDARGMSAERMQTLAREMNFSESTFLLPAETEGTDIRMRIFTPGGELPMAGHPTIGTTFALADTGVIRPGQERFVFGLGVGPTPVELTWSSSPSVPSASSLTALSAPPAAVSAAPSALEFAWMDQQTPVFREPASPTSGILTAIGLHRDALAEGLPIEEISCGVPYICVPLKSREAVDAAEPDLGVLRGLRSAFKDGHNAVFLFAVEPEGSEVTAYSRMFAPGLGVAEDAATGSAAGPLGCYLVAHELVPESNWTSMVSLQGVKMRRPSRIHIRITARAPQAVTRVQVGGRAVKIGEGKIVVP
jgi:trans-2,3-dihydro-3-hydroxyanthranilate isomerase